jgi:hypothetical protein
MIREFFNTPPFMMIAAAPEGSPPRRISNIQFKKNPARRASERPLGGVPSYTLRFSWFGCEHDVHAVSTEPNYPAFIMKSG